MQISANNPGLEIAASAARAQASKMVNGRFRSPSTPGFPHNHFPFRRRAAAMLQMLRSKSLVKSYVVVIFVVVILGKHFKEIPHEHHHPIATGFKSN